MGSDEGSLYTDLTPALGGREVVSDRPLDHHSESSRVEIISFFNNIPNLIPQMGSGEGSVHTNLTPTLGEVGRGREVVSDRSSIRLFG